MVIIENPKEIILICYIYYRRIRVGDSRPLQLTIAISRPVLRQAGLALVTGTF